MTQKQQLIRRIKRGEKLVGNGDLQRNSALARFSCRATASLR